MRILEITESTRLPLRLVIGLVSGFCLGTIWLTTMFIQVSQLEKSQAATSQDIASLKVENNQKRDEVIQYLHRLDKKITEISVKLNIRPVENQNEREF